MRPEQNMYLVDGAQNSNRMDGGYALASCRSTRLREFRILTQSAPAEFGGTAGATTSVVTRSGSNQLHGSVYEFVRNDAFDARNFFSEEVEPLKQHQFGGTLRRTRFAATACSFFGYYEGFRNKQGMTTSATVPTARGAAGRLLRARRAAAQPRRRRRAVPGQPHSRAGDQPGRAQRAGDVPAGQRLAVALSRDAWSAATTTTRRAAASTSTPSPRDQLFARYSYSGGNNINPISVRGTDAPGFPTRDDFATHSLTVSSTRIITLVADQLAARRRSCGTSSSSISA